MRTLPGPNHCNRLLKPLDCSFRAICHLFKLKKSQTIHEITRNITKHFVLFRVVSWIALSQSSRLSKLKPPSVVRSVDFLLLAAAPDF